MRSWPPAMSMLPFCCMTSWRMRLLISLLLAGLSMRCMVRCTIPFARLQGCLLGIFLSKLHLDFHGLAKQGGQVRTLLLLNGLQVLGRVVLTLVTGSEREGHAVLETQGGANNVCFLEERGHVQQI